MSDIFIKKTKEETGWGREESLNSRVIAKRELVGGGSGGRGETADVCREGGERCYHVTLTLPLHLITTLLSGTFLFQSIILNFIPIDFLLNSLIGL